VHQCSRRRRDAVDEIDGELEALGDEAGEEEEVEGDDLEEEKVADDVGAGVAGGVVLEAALARGGEGEAHEDGDREEGVDVDEAVEGGDVDAHRAPLAHLRLAIRFGEAENNRQRDWIGSKQIKLALIPI